MSTIQVTDSIPAVLAELFADAPYVKKLAYYVHGTNVLLRAIFDDDGDYPGRLREVGRRFTKFEEIMAEGIMPEIEVRMQAAESSRGWPDGISGLKAVIDR